MKNKKILFLIIVCFPFFLNAQVNEFKLKLSEDGDKYIKATFLNQTWLRLNESNPGTWVQGEAANHTLDIGLRRTRAQLFGKISDHVFFYTQFGMNNFNSLSQNAGNRKLQAFFHDALAEYWVFKDKNWLKFGGGLTIANGLSRFSQPAIGSIMTMDVPVFAQATVDQTDEFSRKLSVYARGQAGNLDYRVILSDPFPVNTNGQALPALSEYATFAQVGHHKQYQGLFIWNFLEKEQNTTPYMTGTYLGKKKVLNLEAGGIYQKAATWRTVTQNTVKDTVYDDMKLASLAMYWDTPLNKAKGTAISAYLGYFYTHYGKNYLRNNGIMNPANGLSPSESSFNGPGNAYPMFGTGHVVYGQAGFLLPEKLIQGRGVLMPYLSGSFSVYERLNQPSFVWNTGINWFISGHTSKITLDYQRRPVFDKATLKVSEYKSGMTLQYQVFF
ncbi:MAG: hypothetical protein K1X92_04175 [Bacteroidia bacterium]|nr:hypothetical protein [Bacteroidia bacterium]